MMTGFAIFGGTFIAMGIITSIYPISMMDLTRGLDPILKYPNALWILQIASTTIPLLLAPIVFGRFFVKQPREYLKPTLGISPLLFPIILGVAFFVLPLMEVLVNLNERMVLPDFLKGLEEWIRQRENQSREMTGAMLKMVTISQMLFSLFIVALVTACAEELLFRGCLQTIFTKWTKNVHVSIWITATLFSAFHLQFFGFLPRLMLGVLFGYFVAWSGSIWTSVWAHFINNGLAVVVTYLYQHKMIKINPDDQHVFNYSAYAFSLLITVLLLLLYRRIALAAAPELEEE
jgi:membrane protease YdiL (CAAX protease family)